jgi:hypothetical protein
MYAIHADMVTSFQEHGRIAATNHGRYAHLTRDDCGMRKRRTHISDNGSETGL